MNFSMLATILGVAAGLAGVPGGAADAQVRTVTVTRADCQRLVRHLPGADVAYQPGVDVQGRPVVSADLNGGSRIRLPETFSFDIRIQPIDFVRRGLNETTLGVGTVTFDLDGNVSFNGVPLVEQDRAALARRCQERLNGNR